LKGLLEVREKGGKGSLIHIGNQMSDTQEPQRLQVHLHGFSLSVQAGLSKVSLRIWTAKEDRKSDFYGNMNPFPSRGNPGYRQWRKHIEVKQDYVKLSGKRIFPTRSKRQ
jgi:hypothetical protein